MIEECCKEYQVNDDKIKKIDMEAIINILRTNVYHIPGLLYLEGGLAIPLYNQLDYSHIPLGNTTMDIGGCGYTSLAMIVSYLRQEAITPDQMAAPWAQEEYWDNVGMCFTLPQKTADYYGLGTVTQTTDSNAVYQALLEGKPVMSSQGPGEFTNGGHLIVLRGIDENGNVLVNDPYGINAYDKGFNERTFSMDEINAANQAYFIFECDGPEVKV